MRLAVASGKGGTGKTTLAVGLALALASASPRDREPVTLLDCDVEQPNAHLFFELGRRHTHIVKINVPEIHPGTCTACGECATVCKFGALAVVKGRLLAFPDLCHGCGACWLTCSSGGITRGARRVGYVADTEARTRHAALRLVWGELDPGQPLAPPVISKVKEVGGVSGVGGVSEEGRLRESPAHHEARDGLLSVLDAPPGTSCPLVETVRATDFCLLVTEPTPFGLHDLELAAEVLGVLAVPSAVVINRDGMGDSAPIERACSALGLPVVLKIPFSRRIAETVAGGGTLLDADPSWATRLHALWGECARLARGARRRAGGRT